MKKYLNRETGRVYRVLLSSLLLWSTFHTAIFILYVGSSDTASPFCSKSTSDFKQYFDGWSRRHGTCGGGGCGSHADHLAWLINDDIRVVEH